MNKILIILLMTLLLALPAHSQDDNPWKEYEVCVFGMPYIGHAVKQGSKGLITEILQAVYAQDDIGLEHRALPYVRALDEVSKGLIHCTLGARNARKGIAQGGPTIAIYDLSVAYMYKTGFKDAKELSDQRVAFLHGFGIDNFLPVKIKPQLVYDLSSAFHMLDRGHVKYVLGDSGLLRDAIRDSKLPSSDFRITQIESYEIVPLFAPTKAGRKYKDIYDRRMREMIETGELAEVMRDNGLGEKAIQRLIDNNAKR